MRIRLAISSLLLAACGGDDGSAATETDGDTSTSTDATTTQSATETDTGGDTTTTSATTESSTTGETTASDSTDTGIETMAVTIDFAALVGDEPFACGQTYADVGTPPTEVEPRDLRLFVQDLQLVRSADGTAVPVVLDVAPPWQAETVAMLDFEDGTGACADAGGDPETNHVLTGTIPADDYDGVRFTIGVPEDLNHADPLELPEPLQASSMTWGWLFGYKFVKAELEQVVGEGASGDGTLHLGSNGCEGNPGAGEVVCALPNRAEIALDGFDPATSTVTIDVAALFSAADLTIETACHSFQAECEPLFASLGVDLETGLPTASQVVFAVE